MDCLITSSYCRRNLYNMGIKSKEKKASLECLKVGVFVFVNMLLLLRHALHTSLHTFLFDFYFFTF